MKKLNFLFAIMAIAIIGFMSSSCDDEEGVGPTLELTTSGGGITTDATITAGSSFIVSWVAMKGDVNLAEFTITRDDVNVTGYPQTDIANDNYSGTATLTPPTTPAVYVYKLVVTDKDGLTAEKTLNITVEAGGSLKTAFSITLGAQENDIGSFCNAYDGTVYKLSTVTSHYGDVDFIYYKGKDNGPFIAGPTDSDIQTITWSTSSNPINWSNWTPKNATAFVDASSADYTDATYASVETLAGSASATQIINLSTGDVVGFKTADGKYGVFHATSVSTATNGTITIEVKIQE